MRHKPIEPNEIKPELRKFYDFATQKALQGVRHILATCPNCRKKHWQTRGSIKKRKKAPHCRSCSRIKFLTKQDLTEQVWDFVDFKSQRLIETKNGKKRLMILVTCPFCRESRWIGTASLQKWLSACCHKCNRTRKADLRKISTSGYVDLLITKLPPQDQELARATSKQSRIGEHRLVMAKHLNRPLKSYEHVHHRNDDKADNRLANLRLVGRNAHSRAPADSIAKLSVEIEDAARTLETCGIDPLPILSRTMEHLRELQPRLVCLSES